MLCELETTGVEQVVIAAQGLEVSARHALQVTSTERLGDCFQLVHIPNVTTVARLTAQPPRRVQKPAIHSEG